MTVMKRSMRRYVPRYLREWEMPSHYAGETWEGYYSAGVGRSRDSDVLERANFVATCKALGLDPDATEDAEGTTVHIVRESHWAVGWVEWIAIHQGNGKALRIADKLAERREEYPILDDDLFSDMEDQECAETWRERMSGAACAAMKAQNEVRPVDGLTILEYQAMD